MKQFLFKNQQSNQIHFSRQKDAISILQNIFLKNLFIKIYLFYLLVRHQKCHLTKASIAA